MEKQLSIFDLGVEDTTVIHFDNEIVYQNDEVIKIEDIDYNDEYNSIA